MVGSSITSTRLKIRPTWRDQEPVACVSDGYRIPSEHLTYTGGTYVPNLISGERLRQAVSEGSFIIDGVISSVENVKYDFHLGDRVLKASFGQPIDLDKIPEDKRCVDPGEAVFVLSKERLNLPNNIIATLTPKRKLAHGGILILGGLAVDPLYKGFLLIGLYNFSSTAFPLQQGKKIIGALFYELDKSTIDRDAPVPAEIKDFPDELTALIKNYKPFEINGIGNQVAELSRELSNLRSEITNDKSWRDDFKQSLEEHNRQLDKLIEGLSTEKDLRAKEDEKINSKLDDMSKMFFGLNLVKGILVALALMVLGVLAGEYIPKLL